MSVDGKRPSEIYWYTSIFSVYRWGYVDTIPRVKIHSLTQTRAGAMAARQIPVHWNHLKVIGSTPVFLTIIRESDVKSELSSSLFVISLDCALAE